MKIKTIRETLRYVDRYRNAKIAIKIDSSIAEQDNMGSVAEDIALMQSIGMKIEIIEPPKVSHSDDEEESLSEDELVARVAVEKGVNKLIYLTNRDGVFLDEEMLREISVEQAEKLLHGLGAVSGKMREKVKASIFACQNGVSRVHILNSSREGILLREIFSCQGAGTMIFRESTYQDIRQGEQKDIIGISEILATNDFYLPLSEISKKISSFFVFVIDEVAYGCVLAEKCASKNNALEVSYLLACVDEQERVEQKLLTYLIDRGINMEHIYLEASKNPVWLGLYPWFLKLGFKKYHSQDLSWTKKNHTAEVWVKTL